MLDGKINKIVPPTMRAIAFGGFNPSYLGIPAGAKVFQGDIAYQR